jgi:hypothetical protein
MLGHWCALTVYISRQLDALEDALATFVLLPRRNVETWYRRRTRGVFSKLSFLVFLACLGIPLCVGLPYLTKWYSAPTPWFSSAPQRFYFQFLWCLFTVEASRHCAISTNLVLLMRDISCLPLKLGLDLESSKSVRDIAVLFFGIALHYAVLTTFAYGMVIFSPYVLSPAIYACLAFAALFLVFIFIGPQWWVHVVMVREKRERIRLFNSHFDEIVGRIEKEPKDEYFKKFDTLTNFRGKLTKMPEWPFDVKLLGGVLTAVVIPIAVAILQVIYGK